jgi:hypothetical protein
MINIISVFSVNFIEVDIYMDDDPVSDSYS